MISQTKLTPVLYKFPIHYGFLRFILDVARLFATLSFSVIVLSYADQFGAICCFFLLLQSVLYLLVKLSSARGTSAS